MKTQKDQVEMSKTNPQTVVQQTLDEIKLNSWETDEVLFLLY